MVLLIHNKFSHCGKRAVSVYLNYTLITRQLNPTTVIFVINVELLDWSKVKNNC